MPQVGEFVPDFALLNQDGKTIRLSDYRGKKVILFAFPKADTLGCNMQACSFRDEFPRVESSNAVILGISGDNVSDLKNWKADKNLPYDLVSDPDHAVLKAWSAYGTSILGVNLKMALRACWVISENGRLLDAQVGILNIKGSVEKAIKLVEGLAASV
jgi:peroxiredoxin Q/BCP